MNLIFTMLHAPKLAFEQLRERGGGFALPFILGIIITLAGMLMQFPVLERELLQNEQIANTPGVDEATMLAITKWVTVGGAAFAMAVSIFISGLLLLIVNLIIRGEATYWQLVKVAVYSGIPGWLSLLVSGLLAMTTSANSVLDLTISAAVLLERKEGLLYGIMSLLNPFSLWSLALMVVGTAVMSRRASSSVAAWIVGGWIVISLGSILLFQL